MIKLHTSTNGIKIAEILPGPEIIANPDDILDIMGDARYNGSNSLIIHSGNLHPDFFDLKTKLAGEILQKFSNYRMRLAIIGDFSELKSKSLRDFIRESNKGKTICFVDSLDKALSLLDH
jgi:hypothetical protein